MLAGGDATATGAAVPLRACLRASDRGHRRRRRHRRSPRGCWPCAVVLQCRRICCSHADNREVSWWRRVGSRCDQTAAAPMTSPRAAAAIGISRISGRRSGRRMGSAVEHSTAQRSTVHTRPCTIERVPLPTTLHARTPPDSLWRSGLTRPEKPPRQPISTGETDKRIRPVAASPIPG